MCPPTDSSVRSFTRDCVKLKFAFDERLVKKLLAPLVERGLHVRVEVAWESFNDDFCGYLEGSVRVRQAVALVLCGVRS